MLVVVVGSAQKSHEARNPFTAGERIAMIKGSLDAERDLDQRKILIIPVPDVDIHYLWTKQVDMLVPAYDLVIANDPFTTFLFREKGVKVIEAPLQKRSELSATNIRSMMSHSNLGWRKLVPPEVATFIKRIDGVARVKTIAEGHGSSRHPH
jgi:nicotinamide-nucleotide adenylyltransferase